MITWLLLRGARESSTANNIMVVIKLLALAGVHIGVGMMNIDTANGPRSRRMDSPRIHQGAGELSSLAYIGFDAISTAAEETTNPQRYGPAMREFSVDLAVCTLIYLVGRRRGSRVYGAYTPACSCRRTLARALELVAGYQRVDGSSQLAERRFRDDAVDCSRFPVTGQRGIVFSRQRTACCRSGRARRRANAGGPALTNISVSSSQRRRSSVTPPRPTTHEHRDGWFACSRWLAPACWCCA